MSYATNDTLTRAAGTTPVNYLAEENTGKPLIYRLDPRTKLLCLVLYSILTLIFFSLKVNFIILLFIPLIWISAGIPRKKSGKLLVSTLIYTMIIFFTQLIMVSNKLNNSQQAVESKHLFSILFVDVTDLSLEYSLTIAIRLSAPLLAAILVILTSDSMDIVRSLSKMGLPPQIILVTASTFRLLPLAFEEMKNIREAQKVRGLRTSRAGALKNAVFPWLICLLRMAHNIGISVESKGFANRNRGTELYKDPQMTNTDYIVIAAATVILIAGLYLRFIAGIGVSAVSGIC